MRSAKLPECVYVCVPSGNAYQAASPALTAFGAESRPRSSPPTTRNYLCGQLSCPRCTSAHPPMRKATAFLTLANARRWRAYSYLVSNACVLYGNAYQAASPALTAFGAESRPRSSPPTTLKLAFLYGNAFFAADINSCTLFYAQATLAHERLNTSSPLHFLGRFCSAKTYLRNTLRDTFSSR